jgi:hypothetical protein
MRAPWRLSCGGCLLCVGLPLLPCTCTQLLRVHSMWRQQDCAHPCVTWPVGCTCTLRYGLVQPPQQQAIVTRSMQQQLLDTVPCFIGVAGNLARRLCVCPQSLWCTVLLGIHDVQGCASLVGTSLSRAAAVDATCCCKRFCKLTGHWAMAAVHQPEGGAGRWVDCFLGGGPVWGGALWLCVLLGNVPCSGPSGAASSCGSTYAQCMRLPAPQPASIVEVGDRLSALGISPCSGTCWIMLHAVQCLGDVWDCPGQCAHSTVVSNIHTMHGNGRQPAAGRSCIRGCSQCPWLLLVHLLDCPCKCGLHGQSKQRAVPVNPVAVGANTICTASTATACTSCQKLIFVPPIVCRAQICCCSGAQAHKKSAGTAVTDRVSIQHGREALLHRQSRKHDLICTDRHDIACVRAHVFTLAAQSSYLWRVAECIPAAPLPSLLVQALSTVCCKVELRRVPHYRCS